MKAFSEAIINYFLGHQGRSIEQLRKELHNEGLTSLKNHRTYWMHERPIPEWVLEIPAKKHLQSQNQLKPMITNSIKSKHGPICISGVQLSEIFTLKLGFPDIDEMKTLQRRIKHDNDIPNRLTEPHPIP